MPSNPISVREYYLVFAKRLIAESYSSWKKYVFPTIVIAVLVFMLSKQADSSTKTAFILTLKAAGIYTIVFAIYHLLRTPWKLQQETEKRHNNAIDAGGQREAGLKEEIRELKTHLLKESSPTSEDPQINIAFASDPLPLTGEHFVGERPVILTNDGETAALDVYLDDVILPHGIAVFPDVGLIKPHQSVRVRPEIEGQSEGSFSVSEFEGLLQVHAPVFEPFTKDLKINYADTNRKHGFVTEATITYGADDITRVSAVNYLKEPINSPVARIRFAFDRDGCAYLYVKNMGIIADFFATLRVKGSLAKTFGDVHARWTHSKDVRTKIPGGIERKLLLARRNTVSDGLVATSQWEVFFTTDEGVDSVNAMYSSAIGEVKIEAPDIVLDVVVASEPDMRGGVQSKRIMLRSNGAVEVNSL